MRRITPALIGGGGGSGSSSSSSSSGDSVQQQLVAQQHVAVTEEGEDEVLDLEGRMIKVSGRACVSAVHRAR